MARDELDPKVFWREYEKQCGEKILAYGLGRYLGGWDDYPEVLWGIAIALEGSFRFHHFAHKGWFEAFIRTVKSSKMPEEKIIVIPRENILSAEYRKEKNILKRFLFSPQPLLKIQYSRTDGPPGTITVEMDDKAKTIAALFEPHDAGVGQHDGTGGA